MIRVGDSGMTPGALALDQIEAQSETTNLIGARMIRGRITGSLSLDGPDCYHFVTFRLRTPVSVGQFPANRAGHPSRE